MLYLTGIRYRYSTVSSKCFVRVATSFIFIHSYKDEIQLVELHINKYFNRFSYCGNSLTANSNNKNSILFHVYPVLYCIPVDAHPGTHHACDSIKLRHTAYCSVYSTVQNRYSVYCILVLINSNSILVERNCSNKY